MPKNKNKQRASDKASKRQPASDSSDSDGSAKSNHSESSAESEEETSSKTPAESSKKKSTKISSIPELSPIHVTPVPMSRSSTSSSKKKKLNNGSSGSTLVSPVASVEVDAKFAKLLIQTEPIKSDFKFLQALVEQILISENLFINEGCTHASHGVSKRSMPAQADAAERLRKELNNRRSCTNRNPEHANGQRLANLVDDFDKDDSALAEAFDKYGSRLKHEIIGQLQAYATKRKNKLLEKVAHLIADPAGYNLIGLSKIGNAPTDSQSEMLRGQAFLFPDGPPVATTGTWKDARAFCTKGMLRIISSFRKRSCAEEGKMLEIDAPFLTTLAFLVEQRLKSRGFGKPEDGAMSFVDEYFSMFTKRYQASFTTELFDLITSELERSDVKPATGKTAQVPSFLDYAVGGTLSSDA